MLVLGAALAGWPVASSLINRQRSSTKQRPSAGTPVTTRRGIDVYQPVKNHPTAPMRIMRSTDRGHPFLYLGETERSLQTFRLLLKKYPSRDMAPAAQLYIAEIYELGYNDYVRAIEEYRKATHYSDKDVRERSLYSLADNLFRSARLTTRGAHGRPRLRSFPRQQGRPGVLRLGTTAFSKGQIEEAESYYRSRLR